MQMPEAQWIMMAFEYTVLVFFLRIGLNLCYKGFNCATHSDLYLIRPFSLYEWSNCNSIWI